MVERPPQLVWLPQYVLQKMCHWEWRVPFKDRNDLPAHQLPCALTQASLFALASSTCSALIFSLIVWRSFLLGSKPVPAAKLTHMYADTKSRRRPFRCNTLRPDYAGQARIDTFQQPFEIVALLSKDLGVRPHHLDTSRPVSRLPARGLDLPRVEIISRLPSGL